MADKTKTVVEFKYELEDVRIIATLNKNAPSVTLDIQCKDSIDSWQYAWLRGLPMSKVITLHSGLEDIIGTIEEEMKGDSDGRHS